MTKKSERQPIKADNVAGGAGYILKEELIKGEQLGAYCKMFNEVTLNLDVRSDIMSIMERLRLTI